MLKIPPDYTFLVQIALFIALWLVLKRLWFDPALRIIHERAARSEAGCPALAVAQLRALRRPTRLLPTRPTDRVLPGARRTVAGSTRCGRTGPSRSDSAACRARPECRRAAGDRRAAPSRLASRG